MKSLDGDLLQIREMQTILIASIVKTIKMKLDLQYY